MHERLLELTYEINHHAQKELTPEVIDQLKALIAEAQELTNRLGELQPSA